MRQQLEKGRKRPEEDLEDVPIVEVESPANNFELLRDEGGDAAAEKAESAPAVAAPSGARKRQRKAQVDEESEYQLLLEMAQRNKAKAKEAEESAGFRMQSLNFVEELRTIIGPTSFDACLKLPKSASSIRFIAKIRRWPSSVPQFYRLARVGDDYTVEFTEYGKQQTEVYTALSRINDAEGLLQLALTEKFSPPLLPVVCQTKLFDRDFEYATEIALRGLFIVQQSLPQTFVPMKSKLLESEARMQFLELIGFVARFAFRRCCFKSSIALWKFGLSLTTDDPSNILLLAPVAALYANDREFIKENIDSDLKWRTIPIRYIPDWTFVDALFQLPDDIVPLANEMAKYPFFFEDIGLFSEVEVPPLLSTLGTAFRKRISKFLEGPDLDSALETAATIAMDMDKTQEQKIIIDYWSNVDSTGIELSELVEEYVMPTG